MRKLSLYAAVAVAAALPPSPPLPSRRNGPTARSK